MISILGEIRHFIERGQKGFSSRDAWAFNSYLCSIIPAAMRHYKEKGHGCPGTLFDAHAINDECHKWDEILEEIAQGFEAAELLNNMDYYYTRENDNGTFGHQRDEAKQEQLTEKYKRGMKLFARHFFDLWD